MRIISVKEKEIFNNINTLTGIPEGGYFNEQPDGVYLEKGMFKSPGFVKKKSGWMLESTGKIWGQELFIGKTDNYISYDKTDGVKIAGTITIGNPGDINGSDINNDSNWDNTSDSNFVNVTYPADQTGIQNQIDGKIVSWFTDTDPSGTWSGTDASHNGDVWWNTATNKLKRYSGTAWSSNIEDQKAIDAYDNASDAQDTADGKRRVFTAEPTTPYDIGDLWSAGPTGDLKKCKIARTIGESYQSGDWELASNADHTADIVSAMAYEDMVEFAKLSQTTIIDGGYIKTGLITCDNILAGTLPTSRTEAQCTDADADETSANKSADTEQVQGYTMITSGKISTGLITCDNINTGTLVVDSSNVGIQVNAGGDIEFRCTSYSSFSSITFNKTSYSNKGWDIYFVASGGGGWQSGDLQILPMSSNDSDTVRLGMATQSCDLAIHGDIACDDINCDDISCDDINCDNISCDDISCSDITSNVDMRNILPNTNEGYSLGNSSKQWLTLKSKYVQLTGSITIGGSDALTDNGSIYFSGTHFYGRINGAWKQLDN